MRTRLTTLLAAALLVTAACSGPVPTTPPSSATPGPTPIATVPANPGPTPTPATESPTSSAAPPSPTLTAPPPGPTPSASPGQSSVGGAAALPLIHADAASTSVELAPSTGGRLFVAMQSDKGTLVVLLGARGNVRPGWPALLRGASGCGLEADRTDGSVRAVCTVGTTVRAYALDPAGRPMPGWPVDLPAGDLRKWMSDPYRVVEGSLYVVLVGNHPGSARLARVTRDGSLRSGARVKDRYTDFGGASIGPDGAAYVVGLVDGGMRSTIWALDLDGVRPGFPVDIEVEGWPSSPAFGPDGRVYVTVDDPGDEGPASSRVVALSAYGRVARGWPVAVPIDTWTTFGDPTAPPFPPVVASDGTVFVTGWIADRPGLTAYALRPSGALRAGWPYRSREPIRTGRPNAFACSCEPCSLPATAIQAPIAGPDDSLVLAQIGDAGSRLVAVRPDGRMKAGWPVALLAKGSGFVRVAAGPGGVVYAFAVEPAGSRRNDCGERYAVHAGTIVALDGHGDPIYTTAIVAP